MVLHDVSWESYEHLLADFSDRSSPRLAFDQGTLEITRPSAFYLSNVQPIRGRREIDLTVDPPPDLVIEIDITRSSLSKLPIYAQLGIPEVWRYDGEALSILMFESGAYLEREESLALPGLTRPILSSFLSESKSLKRTGWLRRLRAWLRQNA